MDMSSKTTRQEIGVLLQMLVQRERHELALLMLERIEAERLGREHYPDPLSGWSRTSPGMQGMLRQEADIPG